MEEIRSLYIKKMLNIKKFISIICIFLFLPSIQAKKLNETYMRAYFKYLNGLQEEKNFNYSSAISLYNDAIRIYKKFPEPYYRIGLIYTKKFEYNMAITYFKIAEKYEKKFKNKTDYINFLVESAKLFYKVNDNENALKFYNKLYKIKITPEIVFRIGEIYYRKKRFLLAKNYLEKFVKNTKKFDEKLEKALKILVNINMDEQNYAQALKYLKLLYKHFPTQEIKKRISILSNNLRYYDEK